MADDATKEYKVRNTAKGPRGVNAADGYVELAPGQTQTVQLTAAEFRSAKSTGYFDFDKDAEADDQADADDQAGLPNNVPKLKKIAKDEGIDVTGATTAADLQRIILDARRDKAAAGGTGGGAGSPPTDDLDALSDDDLRNTVAAITGQTAPEGADRLTLLKLARGQA